MGEVPLQDWVGRSQELVDTIHPTQVQGLSATLNAAQPLAALPGDRLPELWHWLYFLPHGADVRDRRRTATPSAAASCRRWRWTGGCGPAGGSTFHGELRVGDVGATALARSSR